MTKFLKIKKLVSRHTKGFQAINEHMLLQNCGEKNNRQKKQSTLDFIIDIPIYVVI